MDDPLPLGLLGASSAASDGSDGSSSGSSTSSPPSSPPPSSPNSSSQSATPPQSSGSAPSPPSPTMSLPPAPPADTGGSPPSQVSPPGSNAVPSPQAPKRSGGGASESGSSKGGSGSSGRGKSGNKQDDSPAVAAAVVGVVIGVIAFALLLCIAACVCCARRKKKRNSHMHMPYYTDQHGNVFYANSMPKWPPSSGPMDGHHGGGWQQHSQYSPGQGPLSEEMMSGSHGTGPMPPPSPAMSLGFGSQSSFTYEELASATGGFSKANLLGQGGFGHVYRGTLGAQEVAIKRLRPGSGQGDREFRAEVESIGRVHHRHLVSLLAYCVHADQRLLVYEHVPNHTLEFHLHGKGDGPMLDWDQRWRIALGSAKGLAYLHEDCHPKIIHRDIKAANILLEDNFEPKVADFGLAKIQNADDSHVSTRVMGTFGYIAPEYTSTGKITDRSDVFSFGVVLLEIITGMKPVLSDEPDNDETLVSWAQPLLTKALHEQISDELVDPQLESNYDAHEMQRLIACAAAAVRHTARSRPRMSQIVRYLEGELPLDALNAGVEPGQSETHDDGGTEQLRRMRRMAFLNRGADSDTGVTGFVSEATSEYGLYASSSSSGGDDAQATSRPRIGELGATSRRTRPGHAGVL